MVCLGSVPVLALARVCLPACWLVWLAGWLADKNILTCYWHVSDMLQSRISGFTPALRSLARVCVRAKPIGRVNPFGKVVFGKVVSFGIWYLVFGKVVFGRGRIFWQKSKTGLTSDNLSG
jgi:hypothetical protein